MTNLDMRGVAIDLSYVIHIYNRLKLCQKSTTVSSDRYIPEKFPFVYYNPFLSLGVNFLTF